MAAAAVVAAAVVVAAVVIAGNRSALKPHNPRFTTRVLSFRDIPLRAILRPGTRCC
jgi:hypothetical protein